MDLFRVIPPEETLSPEAVDSTLLTPIKAELAGGQAQQEHQC